MNPRDEFDSLSGASLPGVDTPANGAAESAPSQASAAQTAVADATRSDGAVAEQLERLQSQAAEQRDLYLRSLADFDNYKKRVDRTIAERSNEGRRELLKRILPVLDNLQRAAEYRDRGTDPAKLVDGLLATVRQFMSALEAEDVRPIDLKGKQFDPALAETIGARHEPGMADNTVVDEARRGYMLGNEVLRPAQVVVSTSDT
ncbi:MAG: nucleotide exchange factor GrpE [Candidatus Eremiobacteraeota bacterium]|nr:nucleotide exchange factor GrpE [Candidatus Eremiobacteraeota bacterium]